jgi:FG-GAP-like repeat/IPT/TIG domain/Secretion system C-terminal sorting domain
MKNSIFLLVLCLLAVPVFAQPVIHSFSPASGPIGTTVTISGAGFDTSPARNVVFFGAVKALVRSASTTQLEVVVPAGATHQPITVTTNQLTAYAMAPFLLTFPSDHGALSASSFAIAGSYSVGTFPTGNAITDLNDDGKPELVTANSVSNSISILKNTSIPGKISFTPGINLLPGTDPKSVASGDLDGDGHTDLVAVNYNHGIASSIAVYRNTSAGGNISFAARQSYDTGHASPSVAITDMNGDGRPDILVTSGNSGLYAIFTNTTLLPGTLSFEKQDFPQKTRPDHLTLADLDKDGRPDLIFSNFSQNSISVFRNTSVGGRLSLAPAVEYGTGTHPAFVTTGDLDGDGKADVIVSNYSDKTISFYKNRSDRGFILLDAKQDRSLSSTSLSVADLNGDGKPDLLSGTYLSGFITVLENTHAGNGKFSFSDNLNISTGTYDTYVSVGDLDGDGKPDLAVTNTMENTVSILRNKSAEPAIIAFSASTGSQGTVITLTGHNLGEATSINFGGTPAESFKIISPTRIDVVVGRGASGDITVTTAWGTATIPGFNFIPAISADGPTAFCQPESVILRSSAQANNQWYRDGMALPQASSHTLLVSTSGSYTVKTIANGITTTSATMAVSATAVTTPVIGLDADHHLVSSAPAGNQWYVNGAPIPEAIHPSYRPLQSGSYTVKSTVNGCSTDFSAAHEVTDSDLIYLESAPYLRLSPNPVKDKLSLAWKLKDITFLDLEIIDATGRRVLQKKNLDSGTAIDLSLLASGMYVIKVCNATARMVYFSKFMKH